MLGTPRSRKKAAELVRYALACEYQRSLILKEHITRDILDEKKFSRCFGPVFNAAQKILHRTLGLHMSKYVQKAQTTPNWSSKRKK